MKEKTMSHSSDDASKTSSGATVIDIRDRLPTRVFGDNPAEVLASKLFKLLLDSDDLPHDRLGAVMLASFALQKAFTSVCHMTEEELRYTRERAQEIAENVDIDFTLKGS
jgi:hypothetical protein